MMKQANKDPDEQVLAEYEKEEKEFRNHRVWRELHCTPEEFFKAVGRHVNSMNIPAEEWERTLNKAKTASRVRSAERRQAYRPFNLQLIGNLRV